MQMTTPNYVIVLWQYRWLNPENDQNMLDDMEWKVIDMTGHHQNGITTEEAIAELRSHRYNKKPIYEVRPLYALKKEDV
jgi:hypothetical protein